MKRITIEVDEKLELLLKQFNNTDTMATRTPIFIVQDRYSDEDDFFDAAYFFSKEEAKKYVEYQSHNLMRPRIYVNYPGYGNEGDWEPFYNLLKDVARQL